MDTFQEVMDLWDSRDAMAKDLDEKPNSVSKWWQRDSIPPHKWRSIVAAAKQRRLKKDGQRVTLEVLARAAEIRAL